MTRKLRIACLLGLFMLLSLAAVNSVRAQSRSQSGSAGPSMGMMQMPLVVPLFVQDQGFDSTLVLVNTSSLSPYADVVLSGLDGVQITQQRVQFTPHSQRRLDLGPLLGKANSHARIGRIEILESPDLKGMSIQAQLTMTYSGSSEPTYIDEEASMPKAEGSQMLRAVADESKGSSLVAITSLSERMQHITIDCLAGEKQKSKSLDLLAGETLITETCGGRVVPGADIETILESMEKGAGRAVGIELRSDAPPASFAAFGLALHHDGNDEYFSGINFTDPKTLLSSTVAYAGVPVGTAAMLPDGTYVPQLALANFSAKHVHAHVAFARTTGDTPSTQDLADIVVPGLSSLQLRLADLQGDQNLQNSFLISSDATVGSLMTKLVSTSETRLREVELLGKDGAGWENGGTQPWSLEDGVDSTLLLFNHAGNSQDFWVQIASDNALWEKSYHLASMQTKAVDFRKLVEDKMKDDKGSTIPTNVQTGHISWSAETAEVAGRILESSKRFAMARSFSCSGLLTLCDASFSDGTTTFDLGLTVNPYGTANPITCYNDIGPTGYCTGDPSYQGTRNYTVSWSTATSTISLSNTTSWPVTATGVDVGSAQANATVHMPNYPCLGQTSGQGVVRPVISSISPAQGLIVNSVSVTLTGRGFGSSPSVNAGSNITVTINSFTTTQIQATFAVSNGHPGGNQSVTVTSGGQTSSSTNFYVQIPQRMVIISFSPAANLPPTTVTDGDVIDGTGQTVGTHQCGMYRNVFDNLVDQRTPAQNIDGTYTIVEHFTNYTSTFGGIVPVDRTFNMTPGGTPTDIQYIGKNAPNCPGNNDHEEFDQNLTIKLSSSASYGLTTVNHIARGNYSGTATVNITNTTP